MAGPPGLRHALRLRERWPLSAPSRAGGCGCLRLPGARRGLYLNTQWGGRKRQSPLVRAVAARPGTFVPNPTRGNPAGRGDSGPACPAGAGTPRPVSERARFPRPRGSSVF
ncbi:uncharacterized protein FN964_010779 [Alca torda]